MSLEKSLADITEQDLAALIANAVAEGRTIDYKRDLKISQDADKKEFLADVSSFANTVGGHLVIGMDEANAQPTNLVGIPGTNSDQVMLQTENIIRNGLDPRIIGIQQHAVPLTSGNVALVIRIPASVASPHMVSYKGTSRFYARNSRGKYQLDAAEIRHAFLASDTLVKRIEDFRLNRLAAIGANSPLYPLPAGGKIVLHVVSVAEFTSRTSVDLRAINDKQELWEQLLPMASGGWDRRYNLEGWLMHSVTRDSPFAGSYTQVFRNGSVEAIDAKLIARNPDAAFWEDPIVKSLAGILSFYKKVNIQAPVVVMLSFLGVSECQAGGSLHSGNRSDSAHPVERDNLICDPIWVDEYGPTAQEILRPAFDLAWNACGYPRRPD
jgi:hypothetical protein